MGITMDDTRETTGPTAAISDGCTVSNHRIGSVGVVLGEPFVNDHEETMIWVKYLAGIKPERFDDLIELGIFKPVAHTDQQ
jgi:hypothetical protein